MREQKVGRKQKRVGEEAIADVISQGPWGVNHTFGVILPAGRRPVGVTAPVSGPRTMTGCAGGENSYKYLQGRDQSSGKT